MSPAFPRPDGHHAPALSDTAEQLHGDDWKAAGMVAGLMVSIFTSGIIMYIIIALSALAGTS
jgi:hypothetical protein